MRILAFLRHEIRAVLIAAVYFAACFGVVMILKHLRLEGYGIAFSGLSTALLLALVTAKVVVLLDRAPLRHRIGLVEVAMRTALYTTAALGFLVLEHAVSKREAAGGVLAALRGILDDPDMPRVWAATICVALAFAGYSAFMVVRRRIGDRTLSAAFLGAAGPEARPEDRTA